MSRCTRESINAKRCRYRIEPSGTEGGEHHWLIRPVSRGAAAPTVSEYFAYVYGNILRVSREGQLVLRSVRRGGALTMYDDIVVSKTTVCVALAGMLGSLLLFAGVVLCAARGFVCLVFG